MDQKKKKPQNTVAADVPLQQGSTWSSVKQQGGGDWRRSPTRRKAGPAPHPVIIGGVGVLVTGDDLGSHPVRGAYEGVSPAHGPVQLSTHAEIHCGRKRKEGKWNTINKPVKGKVKNVRIRGLQSKPNRNTAHTATSHQQGLRSTLSRAKPPRRQDAQAAWELPGKLGPPPPWASQQRPPEGLRDEPGARGKGARSQAKQ